MNRPRRWSQRDKKKMPRLVLSVKQECCRRFAFAKAMPAGLALQGGELGTTELVRGPKAAPSWSPCGRESKGGVLSPPENI